MASNCGQLWSYAQGLETPCEESRRAKISRSYYALFHHARDFHRGLPSDQKGLELNRNSGAHQKLIQQLLNPTAKDTSVAQRSRTIGNFLMLARELRDVADYENSSDVKAMQLSRCLGYVEKGLQS